MSEIDSEIYSLYPVDLDIEDNDADKAVERLNHLLLFIHHNFHDGLKTTNRLICQDQICIEARRVVGYES